MSLLGPAHSDADRQAALNPQLSPLNQRIYNRAGLVASNGTVTLSLPALGLLLDWARADRPAESRVSDPCRTQAQHTPGSAS